MPLEFTGSAFDSGADIPTRHTCEGENISPPLSWRGVPEETDNLVLIFDDPDASPGPGGPFTHWVLYDLPADLTGLPEGFSPGGDESEMGVEGRNSFGNIGYEGPCPPAGPAHRYVFRLYALSADLGLPAGANRSQVIDSIKGHIIEQAEYIGEYASSA